MTPQPKPRVGETWEHEVFGPVKILEIRAKEESVLVEAIYTKERRLACGFDGCQDNMWRRFNYKIK